MPEGGDLISIVRNNFTRVYIIIVIEEEFSMGNVISKASQSNLRWDDLGRFTAFEDITE